MKILKFLLTLIGLFLGVMVLFWVLGLVSSLFWYAVWLGVIGGVIYGGYRLFIKAEEKLLNGGADREIGTVRDFDLSWDEYQKKYLSK